MNRYILILLVCLLPVVAFGQKERADIRQGNKLYQQGKFADSEKLYTNALLKNPTSVEAAYNLAGAIYKQERWKDADSLYLQMSKAAPTPETLYNLGNAEFKQRKLDEAIESYKSSLRINPNDREAKFNLAYAQKLKQEDDNKDKDKDQNKDQQDPKQDKQDQKQDQPKDQDKKEDKKDEPKPEPKPQSRQDAERMLKAIQASEDKTKEKVDAQKAESATRRSAKDW